MRLLLVEDDKQVREYVMKGMKEAGHTIDVAANGKDGLFMATTEAYDVIIMDRMLPEVDGMTVIRTLRGSNNHTPVLILSALANVDDRVEGLKVGGDDYLVKPFSFAELLARIDALGRRKGGSVQAPTRLKAGSLEIDLLTRKVRASQEDISLQTREFRLLEYLMKHKGQIVTRTMLLEAVWDYHFDPQTNVIDVHISRLRKKIGDTQGKLIKTVRGAGYIIEESL